MLSKRERLQRTDFTTFFQKGKRFQSEHATVVYTPLSTFHGSVVVGKKVHKQAVVRNTLRRRVYDQLRQILKNKQTGVFIVVLKPSFKTLNRAEARSHIQGLIERIVKPA